MAEKHLIEATVKDTEMKFYTLDKVFSPKGIDKGTLAMLSVVDFQESDKVLDLGCGYGIVGILAAKLIGAKNVVMTDKDSMAVEISMENAVLNRVEDIKIIRSDGFKDLNEKDFTLILSNPPYHTDFSVAREFIEKGFNRLNVGGKMYMVTKRKDWYKNKLTAIFGGVRVWESDGYFVFMSLKKSSSYANAGKQKKQ